jgi:hypothetical protein
MFNTNRLFAPNKRNANELFLKKKATFFVFLKSRGEDYEISPQFRT